MVIASESQGFRLISMQIPKCTFPRVTKILSTWATVDFGEIGSLDCDSVNWSFYTVNHAFDYSAVLACWSYLSSCNSKLHKAFFFFLRGAQDCIFHTTSCEVIFFLTILKVFSKIEMGHLTMMQFSLDIFLCSRTKAVVDRTND